MKRTCRPYFHNPAFGEAGPVKQHRVAAIGFNRPSATVAGWHRRHHPDGKIGAVTIIQRVSSDLRLNPHSHTLFLDGV